MSEPKIAGPWIEHREDQWVRVDAGKAVVASVFPRGHAGYGWDVGTRSGKEDRYPTSDENFALAKARADDALRAFGFSLSQDAAPNPTAPPLAASVERVAVAKAAIAALSDEEWEQVRPRMCGGCFDRLDEGERCYCLADD